MLFLQLKCFNLNTTLLHRAHDEWNERIKHLDYFSSFLTPFSAEGLIVKNIKSQLSLYETPLGQFSTQESDGLFEKKM